ncbi:DMT family transporter [Ruegeria atlantica]|uniref:DMT family transporter n=1 Tax=Ruegeria atlantica TaxID=81569 RepID=UPI00147FF852|nr:multidrug efflux SMR transporter [Ruegeria atlantica]
MNAWGYLLVAISLEIAGTYLLKLSDGFAKWQWGSLSILCYSLFFWALAPALKDLPVGVVYAIWAGVGIIGASALGVFLFGDRLAAYQYGFILLILIGAVGLRLTTQA